MSRSFFRIAFVSICLPSSLCAQTGADRHELGQKLRGFERALESQKDETIRKRVLTELKPITFTFFAGKIGDAARMLDKARWDLVAEKPNTDVQWADSVTMRLSHHLIDTADFKFVTRLSSFYSVETKMPAGVKLDLQLGPNFLGLKPPEYRKRFDVDKLPFEGSININEIKDEGDYILSQVLAVGDRELAGSRQTLSLVDKLLPRLKKIEARLETLKDTPAGTDRFTARRIYGILSDLSEGKTLETDYPATRLLGEAEAALNAIDKKTPYYGRKRPGSFYLSLATKKGDAPVRLLAPKDVEKGEPLPLVIALHGAGGSENMFFDGYGDGKIVGLCDQRGWLLVTPRNGVPEGLIDGVDALYPVDRKRVFLVGHSMGAAQAVASAAAKPEMFASVAALGGGGVVAASEGIKSVPFFVGVGTEDFALGGARQLRDRLKKLEVKKIVFREYDGVEHLSIVQLSLKDVFAFFDAAAKP